MASIEPLIAQALMQGLAKVPPRLTPARKVGFVFMAVAGLFGICALVAAMAGLHAHLLNAYDAPAAGLLTAAIAALLAVVSALCGYACMRRANRKRKSAADFADLPDELAAILKMLGEGLEKP